MITLCENHYSKIALMKSRVVTEDHTYVCGVLRDTEYSFTAVMYGSENALILPYSQYHARTTKTFSLVGRFGTSR